jgi:hypothetical protein
MGIADRAEEGVHPGPISGYDSTQEDIWRTLNKSRAI